MGCGADRDREPFLQARRCDIARALQVFGLFKSFVDFGRRRSLPIARLQGTVELIFYCRRQIMKMSAGRLRVNASSLERSAWCDGDHHAFRIDCSARLWCSRSRSRAYLSGKNRTANSGRRFGAHGRWHAAGRRFGPELELRQRIGCDCGESEFVRWCHSKECIGADRVLESCKRVIRPQGDEYHTGRPSHAPAVQVIASRAAGLNGGAIGFWFAKLFGVGSGPASATAVAVYAAPGMSPRRAFSGRDRQVHLQPVLMTWVGMVQIIGCS